MKRLIFFLIIIFFLPLFSANASINGSLKKDKIFIKTTGLVERVKIVIPLGSGKRYIAVKKAQICNRKNPPDCYFDFDLSKKAAKKVNQKKRFRIRAVFLMEKGPAKNRYRCNKKNGAIICSFYDRV